MYCVKLSGSCQERPESRMLIFGQDSVLKKSCAPSRHRRNRLRQNLRRCGAGGSACQGLFQHPARLQIKELGANVARGDALRT